MPSRQPPRAPRYIGGTVPVASASFDAIHRDVANDFDHDEQHNVDVNEGDTHEDDDEEDDANDVGGNNVEVD